jgi:hypothetical protein
MKINPNLDTELDRYAFLLQGDEWARWMKDDPNITVHFDLPNGITRKVKFKTIELLGLVSDIAEKERAKFSLDQLIEEQFSTDVRLDMIELQNNITESISTYKDLPTFEYSYDPNFSAPARGVMEWVDSWHENFVKNGPFEELNPQKTKLNVWCGHYGRDD